MLHLQGNLQVVFDALYDLGIIEPVLEKEWREDLMEIEKGSPQLAHAVNIVNMFGHDSSLLATELGKLDRKSLEILAMEVAREYADFHSRQKELH